MGAADPSPIVKVPEGAEKLWRVFWAIRNTLDADKRVTATDIHHWCKVCGAVVCEIDAKAIFAMDAQFGKTLAEERAYNDERRRGQEGR